MHEWLVAATKRLAEKAGGAPGDYMRTQGQIASLLELARVAAHESGERTNAPLVSYLVGLALGRHGGDLDVLVDAVVGKRV